MHRAGLGTAPDGGCCRCCGPRKCLFVVTSEENVTAERSNASGGEKLRFLVPVTLQLLSDREEELRIR